MTRNQSAAIQTAAEDIKATTGIYDASLGAWTNETSGIAIAQRQAEAEKARYELAKVNGQAASALQAVYQQG